MEQLTYFIITRKIFESPIWRDEPHILKLFIYLIGTARHSKDPKKYNGFDIKRGELVTSLSILADNNEFIKNGRLQKWSRAKVSRMLNTLVEQKYITLLSDTYGTHIKICNYDTYQDTSTYKVNTSETILKQNCNDTETELNTNNNDKNDNNGKNDKKQRGLEFSQIEFPETLNTEVIKESYKQWFHYLKEKRKKPTKTTIEMQLKFLSTSPAHAVKIIERSIEKGWIGLFELPTNLNCNNGKSTKPINDIQDTKPSRVL